jgi:hypothetical protein
MRDDPLNQHLDPTEHLDETEMEMARLDQRLIHALESAPKVQAPADFAARVVSRLPARRSVSLTRTHYGYYAMLVGMVILLATLLLLAPQTADRSMFELTLQWLLCAQFIGLAVWLSARSHRVF